MEDNMKLKRIALMAGIIVVLIIASISFSSAELSLVSKTSAFLDSTYCRITGCSVAELNVTGAVNFSSDVEIGGNLDVKGTNNNLPLGCNNITGDEDDDFCVDVDTNASTICTDGEYHDGGGPCINFNDTVDDITKTINNIPINVNVTTGTLDAGNISSIQTAKDGSSLNISEVSGADPIVVIINFTGVVDITSILMRVWYSNGVSTHTIAIGLYDYNDKVYEEEYGDIEVMPDFAFITRNVFDATDHLTADGNASLRLRHVQNGNTAHDLYIDYVELTDGFSTTVSSEHDAQSGRNETSNHPWAASQEQMEAVNVSTEIALGNNDSMGTYVGQQDHGGNSSEEIEASIEDSTELVLARLNITNSITIRDDQKVCFGDQNDFCQWYDSTTGTFKEGS